MRSQRQGKYARMPELALALLPLFFLHNVERKALTLGDFRYDEPCFLLLQELREPSRYFAVLEAIAGGRTRLNEIAQAATPDELQQMPVGRWFDSALTLTVRFTARGSPTLVAITA